MLLWKVELVGPMGGVVNCGTWYKGREVHRCGVERPARRSIGNAPFMAAILHRPHILRALQLKDIPEGESTWSWNTNSSAVCANLSPNTKNQLWLLEWGQQVSSYRPGLWESWMKWNLKVIPNIYDLWGSASKFSYFFPLNLKKILSM